MIVSFLNRPRFHSHVAKYSLKPYTDAYNTLVCTAHVYNNHYGIHKIDLLE